MNPIALSSEQYSLSGIVVSVEAESIMVKDSTNSQDVKVLFTTSTAIIKRVALSDDELAEKMKKWEATVSRNNLTPPPLGVEDQEAEFADLLAGQVVTISAQENVADATQFAAVSVIINSD
jgi:hypothetical protein